MTEDLQETFKTKLATNQTCGNFDMHKIIISFLIDTGLVN